MRKKKSTETSKEKDNSLILQKEYHEEIEEDILNYSLSAIVRAIPSIDGLKPVARRILYAMKTEHNTYDKNYRKSVKGVSATMSRFHPHGDSSIYEAMMRLAQDFRVGIPLIDGHGNVGSIDGDSFAASRYVETRLSKFAETLLSDLDKNTVDWADNFDGTEKEPLLLFAKIPNYLILPNQGIAVGVSMSTPPHNLNQVVDCFIYYMDHKKATLEQLVDILEGPDYPTGGIIINKKDLLNMYRYGQGRVIIRSKIEIEHSKSGKESLIVTEIPYPYSGQKQKIIEELNELIISKKLPEVSEVRDESSKEGIRINIILKKAMSTSEIEKLKNKLFKLSPLETGDSYNFLATVDLRPRQLGLVEYFQVYHEFVKEATKRKYEFLLNKYKNRKEVLEGLIKAIDLIDLIVAISRNAKSSKYIKTCLMTGDLTGISLKTKTLEAQAKRLHFTEQQSVAIMAIQLQQLAGLELKALQDELTKVNKQIDQAEKIISSEKNINAEIKKDMLAIKEEFGTPRKTKIIDAAQADYTPTVIVSDTGVSIDKFGYIKAVNNENDDAIFNVTTKTNDKILIFAKNGNAYRIKIEEIVKGKTSSPRGVLIESLFPGEKIDILYTTLESNLKKEKILFISSDALIKVVPGEEFIANKRILKATNLSEGADMLRIENIDGHKEVIFKTNKDREIIRPIKEINQFKKNSRGVQCFRARKDEEMIDVEVK